MKTRRSLVAAALLAGATLFPGCRSLGSNAIDGAVIGSALGAGGGYAIGHHRGNRTNWALGGALAGAMAGWIVGDQMDDRQRDATGGPETIRSSTDDCAPAYVRRERVIVRDECDPMPPGW
jgi:uncharacterized protein YcfJ